ncbi:MULTISPECIES: hypothetical protein [unclassified Nocardia]|uniref:hypothetical protein n=1 Tax=unclassified Nocardia TaxID=2637762 RepID=UPI00278BB5B6|nr:MULTISPECIES: hypothetical protein [unclassified Nocardia]
MRWLAVLAEFLLVPLCGVAAVWSWRRGVQTSWYAPNGDMPGFEAVRYAGPWLLLAAVAVAVGGLLLIDAVARTRRDDPVRTRRTTAGH